MSDYAIYGAHVAFWAPFGLTRLVLRARDRGAAAAPSATAEEPKTAPYSRLLLFFHMVAFGVMYWGLGQVVLPGRVPEWFPGQRMVGVLVMAVGAWLMSWALVSFRSWRIRAKLDDGHQLATGGAFRFLRHPIYLGLDLLALGTAFWVPTAASWIAFGLMVLGSELRARAEEKLLLASFGEEYRAYAARTRRFIPGLY